MLAKFQYVATENGKGEDGLPFYKDTIFVTITRDATHTVTRVAKEEDFARFAPHLAAFEKQNKGYKELEGFPLEMWSALRPSEVATLKMRDIRTVQELANAPKSIIKIMPSEYVELVHEAKRFIELAGMGSGLTEKANELAFNNEALKEELANAQRQIKLLTEKLAKADA